MTRVTRGDSRAIPESEDASGILMRRWKRRVARRPLRMTSFGVRKRGLADDERPLPRYRAFTRVQVQARLD